MCFTVTVLAVWSIATISPVRFFMAASRAASILAGAGAVAGFLSVSVTAGAGAGFFSVWAKPGPTRAGTAAAATTNATNFFMTSPPVRLGLLGFARPAKAAD